MEESFLKIAATVLFGIAVIHTFSVKRLQSLAHRYPVHSVSEKLFHLLGEVEIVFGFWAGVLVLLAALHKGGQETIQYIEGLNFNEATFVFVIMTIAATRPIFELATSFINMKAKFLPLPKTISFYVTSLTVGPLLGSFITEPAAMTVTALILKDRFLDRDLSLRFKYVTLATLFVNISVGGVLTHFAAPPVLMVATTWNWDTPYMLLHFGWKAVVVVVLNTLLATSLVHKELKGIVFKTGSSQERRKCPAWLKLIHVIFLVLVVMTNHHPTFFLGLFLFFIGITIITKEYQDELKLKEGLLVGFFLGGLVILGSLQDWWLKPILTQLSAFPLFIGTTALTAFLDNAALTYLGAQVPSLTEGLKYALVSGAVAGGGLTVIANAPNPAGFSILKSGFGDDGINPISLFGFALLPTVVAMLCFWGLP